MYTNELANTPPCAPSNSDVVQYISAALDLGVVPVNGYWSVFNKNHCDPRQYGMVQYYKLLGKENRPPLESRRKFRKLKRQAKARRLQGAQAAQYNSMNKKLARIDVVILGVSRLIWSHVVKSRREVSK